MNKCALIVDDEKDIVSFMEKFLKRLKISSIKATSGEEALQLYDSKNIDFVLLDIQMEKIDGFTVLKEIKARNPLAKVIIITGKIENEYIEKAYKLGAIDYITKPIDLNELKEKIIKYIK